MSDGFNSEGLPKGQMRQPEVKVGFRPDRPNSPRHAEKKASWKEGQRWETCIDGCDIWCPVARSGYAEPTWDEYQEYRLMENNE